MYPLALLSFFLFLTTIPTAVWSLDCGPNATTPFVIAGSSTVEPLADAWLAYYETKCPNQAAEFLVEGGGSSSGARRVCAQDLGDGETPVSVGSLSRSWQASEAVPRTSDADAWQYDCVGSDRSVLQVLVGYDGLSLVVASGSVADVCLRSIQGLNLDQLRWIFSDFTDEQLQRTGWDASQVPDSTGNAQLRTWRELGNPEFCPDQAIVLAGPDPVRTVPRSTSFGSHCIYPS